MDETLWQLIRRKRKEKGLAKLALADAMSKRRAIEHPHDDYMFSSDQVARLEGARWSVKLESDSKEPLWWALDVLGIDRTEAKRMLGWI